MPRSGGPPVVVDPGGPGHRPALQGMHDEHVEVMHRMFADMAALGVDDEAAPVVTA